MSRADFYSPIHKAVRAVLFDTSALIARTDFGDPAQTAATIAGVRRLLGYLDEHAGLEDAVVMPELQLLAPEVFLALENEHGRMDGMQRQIEALLDSADGTGAAGRQAIGQRLHHALNRLVAAQLLHMEREEVEANRALWAHRTDAELGAIHARILARIPPQRAAEWLALVLPAVSGVERRAVLADLRQKLPAGAFTAATTPARAALGEAAWQAAMAVA